MAIRYIKNKFNLISCSNLLGVIITLVLGFNSHVKADDIKFNTDVLDVNDRDNIDLSQFSHPGYLMEGEYDFTVYVNKQSLSEQKINYYQSPTDPKNTDICLSRELVKKLGLKEKILSSLTWWHEQECLDLSSIPGTNIRNDLSTSSLYISLPQAYLEYTADNWDPPERWEDGISGAVFDYNFNGQVSEQLRSKHNTNYALTGNGVTGFNLGPWRLRADWQTQLNKTSGGNSSHTFDWARYYAYRAIRTLNAKLSLGETYFSSDIFDSFRFTGMSLITDTNMLPPNLRGYAPEVTGVAKSNATVIISQKGHIIYQTQVAEGPFRIQDLNDAIAGELDVKVEEQNGSVQTFTVNTATVPYLTRPGQVRYKLAMGRPSDWHHHVNGQLFSSGEFSWGVNNGWSLYGGAVGSKNYIATAVGIGRDLMALGALSFDVTRSQAKLHHQFYQDDKSYGGNSYRLSYSKQFDSLNSQVTFAGYRFSDKHFMSMSEFMDAEDSGMHQYSSKELYTISYNQQLPNLGISLFFNLDHQTYWDQPNNDRYSISFARYFDMGRVRNINFSLTGYKNRYRNTDDNGLYASISVPWGESGTLSFDSNWDQGENIQRASYYDNIDESSNYQLNTGWGRSGGVVGGFYTYQGTLAQINANATYQQDRYRSAGLSMQGGFTATQQGATFHRSNQLGGTRIFIDTNGVPDIPLHGYGAVVTSNRFGQAVVTDVNSYYRNRLSIDVNELPDNAEITHSVKQETLTEGAIGYEKFNVIAGRSAMAILRLSDNTHPPFGATVFNAENQQVGIVGDNGSVYLTGIIPNGKLKVHWDSKTQCQIVLPQTLSQSNGLIVDWLLPCTSTH